MFGIKLKLKRPQHGKGRFHGDIDDLSVDALATPTSLDESIETIDSDDAVGEMGTPQDDYGQSATGKGVDNTIGEGNGGLDPFAIASFGFGDDGYDGTIDPSWQLDETSDDLAQAYQPDGPDEWNFPEQVATLRHPIVDFGSDFYPFAGPAAIMGGEIGCSGAGLKK